MTDNINEKISQLIDNELQTDEALRLLKVLRQQPEHMQILNRYQLASAALAASKTDFFLPASNDFLNRVNHELKPLPAHAEPARKPKAAQKHSLPFWNRQMFALAASALFLAVIVGGNVYEPAEPLGKPQLPPIASNAQTSAPVAYASSGQNRPINARIYDYLQHYSQNGSSNAEVFHTVSQETKE